MDMSLFFLFFFGFFSVLYTKVLTYKEKFCIYSTGKYFRKVFLKLDP